MSIFIESRYAEMLCLSVCISVHKREYLYFIPINIPVDLLRRYTFMQIFAQNNRAQQNIARNNISHFVR